MMVIRGNVGTLTNHIFPADRCIWQQNSVTAGGYSISDAFYFPGSSVNVGGTTAAGFPIVNPTLGYIGKSGRFVEIAS